MSVLSLIPEERKKCLDSTESVYSANSLKLSCALNKKKIFHPLLSTTTILTMSHTNSNRGGSGDKYIAKRVLSAKEHRLKHLQNQLADAHFHLSELSNENRLLRNLQKRQDSALQRYENSNGDIPKLINSHTEEIRSWQTRYKQMRLQFRDINQRLKDKDAEYQLLSDEHKHLLELSKNGNLREREKLQNQVYELMDKVKNQNDILNTLQRRLTLEAKNHKHQLNIEMTKHKETQQNLTEALKNVERLSTIIEIKEKIISSTASKRLLPKINVAPKVMDISSEPLSSKTNEIIDLSVNGNSISDNQVSFTSEKTPKAKYNGKVKQKCVTQENAIKTEPTRPNNEIKSCKLQSPAESKTPKGPNGLFNDLPGSGLAKAILDGMPHMSIFESDTDVPKSSDDEIKERVEVMKQHLKQMQIDDNMKKKLDSLTERGNVHKNACHGNEKIKHSARRVSEDSSPEEMFNLHEKRQPKKSRKNMKDSMLNDLNDLSEQMKLTDLSSFNPSDLAKPYIDFDVDTMKETKDIDNVLQNFCNEMVTSSENIVTLGQSTSSENESAHSSHKLRSDSENTRENSDQYQENKVKSSLGKQSELNDDKKKKLLAALKAIDRGDDDGFNVNGLRKSKSIYKNLNKNQTK